MNCYDCTMDGVARAAVAACVDCGAGVCLEHSTTQRWWLTRTPPLNGAETVRPAARQIRCLTCTMAQQAAVATTPARPRLAGVSR